MKDNNKRNQKEFVVKTMAFDGDNRCPIPVEKLINEKLAYDILALCGVFVPKTYLVLNKAGTAVVGLASQRYPNARELGKFISNIGYKTKRGEFFAAKGIDGKPIIGLYDMIGPLVFIFDRDGIGNAFSNILLLEQANYYQAIKIDPGEACLGKYFFGTMKSEEYFINYEDEPKAGLSTDFKSGCLLNLFKVNEKWRFSEVFTHATENEIKRGLKTVCEIKPEQLYQIIYNKKIPDSALNQRKRNEIYTTLLARLNRIKQFYTSSLTTFDEEFVMPNLERVQQTRYCLHLELDLTETTEIIESGNSEPTVYHKIFIPAKEDTHHTETILNIKDWVNSAIENYLMNISLFSLFHGFSGQYRAIKLQANINSTDSLIELINLLIQHFGRSEGLVFKNTGWLRDQSLDTILLCSLIKNLTLKSLLLIDNHVDENHIARQTMRHRVSDVLSSISKEITKKITDQSQEQVTNSEHHKTRKHVQLGSTQSKSIETLDNKVKNLAIQFKSWRLEHASNCAVRLFKHLKTNKQRQENLKELEAIYQFNIESIRKYYPKLNGSELQKNLHEIKLARLVTLSDNIKKEWNLFNSEMKKQVDQIIEDYLANTMIPPFVLHIGQKRFTLSQTSPKKISSKVMPEKKQQWHATDHDYQQKITENLGLHNIGY